VQLWGGSHCTVKLELDRWIIAEVKSVSGDTPGTEIIKRNCIKILRRDYLVVHSSSFSCTIKKISFCKKKKKTRNLE
jgi:hypothetical protein